MESYIDNFTNTRENDSAKNQTWYKSSLSEKNSDIPPKGPHIFKGRKYRNREQISCYNDSFFERWYNGKIELVTQVNFNHSWHKVFLDHENLKSLREMFKVHTHLQSKKKEIREREKKEIHTCIWKNTHENSSKTCSVYSEIQNHRTKAVQ